MIVSDRSKFVSRVVLVNSTGDITFHIYEDQKMTIDIMSYHKKSPDKYSSFSMKTEMELLMFCDMLKEIKTDIVDYEIGNKDVSIYKARTSDKLNDEDYSLKYDECGQLSADGYLGISVMKYEQLDDDECSSSDKEVEFEIKNIGVNSTIFSASRKEAFVFVDTMLKYIYARYGTNLKFLNANFHIRPTTTLENAVYAKLRTADKEYISNIYKDSKISLHL